MSGTILYLAIVAIWAGVLVPRWLKHEPQRDPRSRRGDTADSSPDSASLPPLHTSSTPHARAYEPTRENPRAPEGVRAEPANVDSRAQARPPVELERPHPNGRRPRSVVAARRRLFGMLVMFLAAAAMVALAGLAAWWVVLPPVGMLGGYVLLLREAARADAERRQARAAAPRADQARPRARRRSAIPATGAAAASRGDTGITPGTDAMAEVPPEPMGHGSARIVNIGERRGDDIYDQYTDAKLRAVGD